MKSQEQKSQVSTASRFYCRLRKLISTASTYEIFHVEEMRVIQKAREVITVREHKLFGTLSRVCCRKLNWKKIMICDPLLSFCSMEIKPQEYDVLLGRGKSNSTHPGNVKYNGKTISAQSLWKQYKI